MGNRIAIILPNYNMPEAVEHMGRYLEENAEWPHDFIVVDNGSDLIMPSPYTRVRLPKNVQTTGGWLAGLQMADDLAKARQEPYLGYIFTITSASFDRRVRKCPISPMAKLLLGVEKAVGVHAALTVDSTTAWHHLVTRHVKRADPKPRRTWMIENIWALYRASWFDRVGRFDPALTFAWGCDLETSYIARQQGRSLWIDERVLVRKVTDIGYEMDRMNMTADERQFRARTEMAHILTKKYGINWEKLMRSEKVNDAWR